MRIFKSIAMFMSPALIAMPLLFTGALVANDQAAYQPSSAIMEDDPNWNCRTMGNHICGKPSDDEIEWAIDTNEFGPEALEGCYPILDANHYWDYDDKGIVTCLAHI